MSDERLVMVEPIWDGDYFVTLGALRAELKRHGLAIVPIADVPTPEERAVLEACAALPFEFVAEESQQPDLRIGTYTLCMEYAPELAALCRAIRAAKEAK